MNNFIKHETDINGIFWHIDNVEDLGEEYRIIGWIAHSTQIVKELTIGNNVITSAFYSRPDVLQVYKNFPTDLIGVDFIINKDDINEPLDLVFADNSRTNHIGSLLKWVVYYSGFKKTDKDLIVVNDFYDNPDMVRQFAIKNLPFQKSDYHRGKRTAGRYILNGTKEKLEEIIGRKITNWNHAEYANGAFQYCTSTDPIVYHVDSQSYAAMVYLTPDAPLESGTSFFKSKVTGATSFEDINNEFEEYQETFRGLSKDLNFYDKTQFELIDTVGNVYNRLVIFNAKAIHAAAEYFGDSIETSRFFHLFFFDIQ